MGRAGAFIEPEFRDPDDLPSEEPARTTAQEVAAGQAPETPAAVLFTVLAVIGGLVLVALAIVGLAYWLA